MKRIVPIIVTDDRANWVLAALMDDAALPIHNAYTWLSVPQDDQLTRAFITVCNKAEAHAEERGDPGWASDPDVAAVRAAFGLDEEACT